MAEAAQAAGITHRPSAYVSLHCSRLISFASPAYTWTPHSRAPLSSDNSGGRQERLIRVFWQSKKTTTAMPRLGPAHASPSTLNTLFHTLSCTAFSIASAAVDNRPKDPAPTVVLENQIGRVLDNQDPVRMDICAAATTICPAEPCESPLRNRKCQGRSRLKMPTYGAGGGGLSEWGESSAR